MNIFISNLGFDVNNDVLKEYFTPFGEVSSSKVIMDKMTNKSRGFGFIEMPDEAASKNAIAGLNGTTVDNRTIKVNEAKIKQSRPDQSFEDTGGFNNATSFNQNSY